MATEQPNEQPRYPHTHTLPYRVHSRWLQSVGHCQTKQIAVFACLRPDHGPEPHHVLVQAQFTQRHNQLQLRFGVVSAVGNTLHAVETGGEIVPGNKQSVDTPA